MRLKSKEKKRRIKNVCRENSVYRSRWLNVDQELWWFVVLWMVNERIKTEIGVRCRRNEEFKK